MDNFDLIVFGGGPAGYNAAAYAAENGMKVLLFEKSELGGVCLNEGCVPSKTFLNSAKVFTYVKHSEDYGVEVADKGFVSQEAVVARKNKVVKRLVVGVKSKLKNAGVTVIKNAAEIAGKEDGVITVISGNESYSCNNLLIATGSAPVIPPIKGLKEGLQTGFILTNKEILDLTEIPKTLVVVGGGVIGLEMADYYRAAGSEVTVIEMADKIAGPTENNVSQILQKALEKKGIAFRLGAKVCEFSEKSVLFSTECGNEEINADKVLLSIGRRAVTDGLGLERVGVITERRGIVTDNSLRTNVSGIYAAGDVNGKVMLAHTAYREGEVAVNDMLGIKDEINYDSIPSVIYTSPEVACVGLCEEAAAKKNINAEVVSLSLMYSGRYIAENTDYSGVCRLVYDKDKRTLIGAQIIGSYASEYIVAVAELIDLEVPVERIKKIVFPHPTVCEVIREGIFQIK